MNPFKTLSKSTANSPTHFFKRRHCESEDNIQVSDAQSEGPKHYKISFDNTQPQSNTNIDCSN